MRTNEIEKFKTILEARETELTPHLRRRDSIAIEKSPDALDEVQLANERELATRNLERESKILRDVRSALRRIEQGAFGVCVNCEEDIGPKRLKAVPWTPLCISCQEKEDRNGSHGFEDADWLPAKAA